MKVVRAFQGVLLLVLVVLVVLLPQAPAIQAFAPSSGGLLQQRRAAASTTTTATTSRTALVRASANSPDDGGGAGKGKPWDSPEWLMKARNMREKFEKELLKANTLFYDSLSGQDADYLEEAWMNDPVVHLVRPAFQERGHEPIVRACQAIGREAKNKKCRFVPTAAKVNVVGATAWVVFKEHLRTSTGAAGRHPYYVTNVFRRVGKKWRIYLHHATATQDRPASSATGSGGVMTLGDLLQAMGGGNGGGGGQQSGPRIIQLSSNSGENGLVRNNKGGRDSGNQVSISQLMSSSDMDARRAAAEEEAARLDAENSTRRTVNAIREAFDKNMISDTQKQALLTHIIRRAPHGEQTNVEMAYDILLAPLSQAAPDAVADSEYLSSLDEFAEQCRVFAGQLKESEGNQ